MVKLRYPTRPHKRINVQRMYFKNKELATKFKIHTVCEFAGCPNIFECWGKNEITFMILGNICTRNCRFCQVSSGMPEGIDSEEPKRIAMMAKTMKLDYVTITSVSRDDLADGGAGVFKETIRMVKQMNSKVGVKVEALIPDFQANPKAIVDILEEKPDVIAHNLETVRRLSKKIRPKADYDTSLQTLSIVKKRQRVFSKSSLILGMGEKEGEILESLKELREVGCDILTLGQYFSPSKNHLPVYRYISQKEFQQWKNSAYKLGFKYVLSGPWVRSSYKAKEIFYKLSKRVYGR